MSLRNDEGGVTGMLEWLEWVACLHGWRGWRANVGSMLLLLLSLLLKYHPEEKNVECLLLKQWENVPNRSKKWFKEEPYLKSRCCFTLLELVMLGSWICLNPNVGNMLGMCNFVNMPEYAWNITCLNKQGF